MHQTFEGVSNKLKKKGEETVNAAASVLQKKWRRGRGKLNKNTSGGGNSRQSRCKRAAITTGGHPENDHPYTELDESIAANLVTLWHLKPVKTKSIKFWKMSGSA